MRALLLSVLLIGVSTVLCDAEKDPYHPLWNSKRFVQKPLPDEWRPENVPATERDLAVYQAYPFQTIGICSIVARFGIPDRYLVLTKPSRSHELNWLIYDLPGGYAVAFYVTAPPYDGYPAGVIVDPRGKLLRLIK